MTEEPPADLGPPLGPPRRALVLGIATLVVLIVGATAGLLISRAVGTSTTAPGADSIDVGFAQDMRVHHLQAVTMAGITRDHTTDPEIHNLAFDIESTQLTQAGEMTGWLTSWVQPELPPPDRPAMSWMRGSSGHNHGDITTSQSGAVRMPGMASPEELGRLKSVMGKELDVLFLQLMLRHHQGAVPMAQYTIDHAGVGYVRDLAQKIVSSQTAEVTLMIKMLADRGAVPLPAPN